MRQNTYFYRNSYRMNRIFCSAVAISLVFAACNTNPEKAENMETSAAMPESETSLPQEPPATIQVTGDTSQTLSQPIQIEPMAAPPAGAKTAAGMNPPHGEPGHRCDIAVGAPLSSAPGTATGQPVQMQQSAPAANSPVFNSPSHPVQTAPQPVAAPAAGGSPTAAGMNPPHGEPGHDCAIPVGAPLKK